MRHPFTTPFKGLGRFFKDPVLAEEFAKVMGSFQRQVEDGFGRVSAGANVSLGLPSTAVDQEDVEVSLQEFLAPLETDGNLQLIPPGVVVGFDGTWEQAQALIGWEVHTPLLGIYPKWVSVGEDAGTTGGTAAHTHDDHTADEVADTLDDHAVHSHPITSPTGVPSAVTSVERGSGDPVNVGSLGHTHVVTSPTQDNAAAQAHVGDDPNPLEHTSAPNDPPFYTLIPIIKL